jgi:hypothetical protein
MCRPAALAVPEQSALPSPHWAVRTGQLDLSVSSGSADLAFPQKTHEVKV